MIDKEALKYLHDLGYEKEVLVETDKGLFSKNRLERINLPSIETLNVNNLTSIVDFIKENIDEYKSDYLIHVYNEKEVRVLTPLNSDEKRDTLITAEALLPKVYYDSYLDAERFNIMLQSAFIDNEHKGLLLRFTGLIKDEAVKSTGDDGVSQKVTIKTGVASVNEAEVPNPVELAPYRTFQEIEQPESKFIFRMRSGPEAALYEADGGAWRNVAMKRIKEYLEENLKDYENVKIIS